MDEDVTRMMGFCGGGLLGKGLVEFEIRDYTLFPLQMERGTRPEVHLLNASIRNYGDVFWRLISKILLTPFGPSAHGRGQR
jgi:hypothetical protein